MFSSTPLQLFNDYCVKKSFCWMHDASAVTHKLPCTILVVTLSTKAGKSLKADKESVSPYVSLIEGKEKESLTMYKTRARA